MAARFRLVKYCNLPRWSIDGALGDGHYFGDTIEGGTWMNYASAMKISRKNQMLPGHKLLHINKKLLT